MVEVNKGVLEKLILFSIAIVVLPLGLLYGALHGYLDRKALSPKSLISHLLGHNAEGFASMQWPYLLHDKVVSRPMTDSVAPAAAIILLLFGTVTEHLRQITGAVAAVFAVNLVGQPFATCE